MGSCDNMEVGHEPMSGSANDQHLRSELSSGKSAKTGHSVLDFMLDFVNEADGDCSYTPDRNAGCRSSSSEKDIPSSFGDEMNGECKLDIASGLHNSESRDSTVSICESCPIVDICEAETARFCSGKPECLEDDRPRFLLEVCPESSGVMPEMEKFVQNDHCNNCTSSFMKDASYISNRADDGTALQKNERSDDMQEKSDPVSVTDDGTALQKNEQSDDMQEKSNPVSVTDGGTNKPILSSNECEPFKQAELNYANCVAASLHAGLGSVEKNNDGSLSDVTVANPFSFMSEEEEIADLYIKEMDATQNEVSCSLSSYNRDDFSGEAEGNRCNQASSQHEKIPEVALDTNHVIFCLQNAQGNDQVARNTCINCLEDTECTTSFCNSVVLVEPSHVCSTVSRRVHEEPLSSDFSERNRQSHDSVAGSSFIETIANVMEDRITDMKAELRLKISSTRETASSLNYAESGPSTKPDSLGLTGKDNRNSLRTTDKKAQNDVETGSVPQMICPDTILSYSRRKSHKNRLSRNAQSKKFAANSRKTSRTQQSQENFELIFNCPRGKRRLFSKPLLHSSEWGSRSVTQMFLHCIDSNHMQNSTSKNSRGLQCNEQDNENGCKVSTQEAKGKVPASTGRLRLKVKFGKTGGQNLPKVIVADSHAKDNGTRSPGDPNSGVSERIDFLEAKLQNVKSGMQFELNGSLGAEMIEPNIDDPFTYKRAEAKYSECSELSGKPARDSLDDNHKLAAENRYDAGTSPDSEVINAMPDALNNGGYQNESNSVVLSSAEACIAPVAASNKKKGKSGSKKKEAGRQNKHKSSKSSRGKQKEGSCQGKRKEGSCRGKQKEGSCRGKQKEGSGLNSCEILSSVNSAKAPSNASSDVELSCQPLSLPEDAEHRVFGESLRLKSSTEHITCPFVGSKHAEMLTESAVLGSTGIKGHRLPKSLKCIAIQKGSSRSSKSSKSQKGDAFADKGTQQKPQKNKKASMEKDVEYGASDEFRINQKKEGRALEHNVEDGISKTEAIDKALNPVHMNVLQIVAVEDSVSTDSAWVRCDDCHKWRRISAALVDTIGGNCHWVCKDNLNKAFADCSIPQEMSNEEINSELGITEAEADAYDGDAIQKMDKGMGQRRISGSKKACFRGIKVNQFLHRHRKTQTIDEIMVCHCKPPINGQWGCGDGCLNRMLNIECIQGTCPCGDRCSNQQFQQRKYTKMLRFHCGKKGYGLKLLEDVKEGQFLIEYVGEVLDMQAYVARQKEYAANGQKHFYFMTLNGNEVIDAGAKGNLGRFINHSCEPNCRTEKWMVNGEICVGIFALRDIKKDEEVTFDYNYVRVFGAAAKKCYCGSAHCRGYIGGDPLNGDTVVQSDSDEDTSEPVMIEDDETLDSVVEAVSRVGSDVSGAQVGKHLTSEDNKDGSRRINGAIDIVDSKSFPASTISQVQSPVELENSVGKVLPLPPTENLLATEDISSRPTAVEKPVERGSISRSLSPNQTLETTPELVGKPTSASVVANKKFEQTPVEEKNMLSRSRPLMKVSRSLSSSKRAKGSAKLVDSNKVHIILPDKLPVQSIKPKRVSEVSSSSDIETIEKKLNELLDTEGGISKRKDATKGYLKLLLLTVASRGLASSEAIQSNRDLSMILDALLKTKSRTVLADVINKNGLQMLHNIMKQYRRDFKKIPILRKLLKVLEYLAVKEILTLEHIVRGPPCPGMESFKDSMLALTEHDDKQVHQIARNFRDRWIPKHLRKIMYGNKDEKRMEFQRDSNSCRFSSPHCPWTNHGVGPTETVKHVSQSKATPPESSAAHELRSEPNVASQQTDASKIHKRKSRWDQPFPIKRKTEFAQRQQDDTCQSDCQKDNAIGKGKEDQNMEDDAPPGFSSPVKRPSASVSAVADVVVANPQPKFNNRLPVSYGIPLAIVQQFGSPLPEVCEGWVVAPGMPFYPFPPLPPFPRERKHSSALIQTRVDDHKRDLHTYSPSCSGDNRPITTVDKQADQGACGADNNAVHKRTRESFCDLGTRYFRQQKASVPSWTRGWGNAGNIFKPEMGGSESVTQDSKNTFLSQDTRTGFNSCQRL